MHCNNLASGPSEHKISFHREWNEETGGTKTHVIPQCLGAIDGTHMEIKQHAINITDYRWIKAPQRMTTFNSDKVCNSANPTWVEFVHMYELCYLLTRDVFYVTFHWES